MKFCVFIIFIFVKTYISAQIINVEDKRVRIGDSIGYKGFIDMSFNVYKNDKHLTTALGSGQLEAVNRRHFFLLIGGFNLVKAGSSNFLNEGYTHFRYNYDVSSHIVWEAFTQGQYNERTRSLLRGLLGSGARFKLKFSTKQRFYFGVAFMYEHNQYNDATPRQYDVRMSNYLSFNLNFSDKVRFVNTMYYQPLLSDISRHRLASQGSFLFNITKRLVFKATGTMSFDNDIRLPASVPDLIYSWTNGVRWEFGKK
jgi:hypothetical protein